MPEGLSPAEVGKEIAEHREHTEAEHAPGEHAQRDRWVAIIEAVLLSVVALLAAWSGYSAAKWSTESSISLAKASATRTKASLALIQANQIRTLDSVSFNAAETAFASHNMKLFNLDLNRMRPGYRPAVDAWLALHPLKNPHAPPDPSYMPQYKIPQQAAGLALSAQADAYFQARPDGRGNGGQVRAPHRLSGRRPFPCGHRQPLPSPRGALRAGRCRRGAPDRFRRAAPQPSRTAILTQAGRRGTLRSRVPQRRPRAPRPEPCSTGPSPCLVEIDRVRRNPRPFPSSKAQQRGEDLAGVSPHDCTIENKRWAVPAEACVEHDAVVGVGQRAERDAHDTAGLAWVDYADRRWRAPVGEHAGHVESRRWDVQTRQQDQRLDGCRVYSGLLGGLADRGRDWIFVAGFPRAAGKGDLASVVAQLGAPAAPAGRPGRRPGRSRSGSGPPPAARRPCQVRDHCGLVLRGEPPPRHGQPPQAPPARRLTGTPSAIARARDRRSANCPHTEV